MGEWRDDGRVVGGGWSGVVVRLVGGGKFENVEVGKGRLWKKWKWKVGDKNAERVRLSEFDFVLKLELKVVRGRLCSRPRGSVNRI